MENEASELIECYEGGGLSRRQLIAGLIAMASATQLGVAQSAAPAEPTGDYRPISVSINHVGINVTDMDRSIRWYTEMFGLRILVESKDVAVLGFKDGGPDSTTFVLRPTSKPEVNHIMFGVRNYDKDALAAFLKAKGLTLRDDVLSFHVKDPDGIDVQVGDAMLHPSDTVLTHK
jgi:catechol 2,3-dioxygenase-like lactoylglutathione lyase family enzyme